MLVHQRRSQDRVYEGQLWYSTASLLLDVTILPSDHVGCPGFPQIIIAAERCVEEYSWTMTFPLCLVTAHHLKRHPNIPHWLFHRDHFEWIETF